MATLEQRTVNDRLTSPTFDQLMGCIMEWREKNPKAVVTSMSFYNDYDVSATASEGQVLSGTISYALPTDDNGGY